MSCHPEQGGVGRQGRAVIPGLNLHLGHASCSPFSNSVSTLYDGHPPEPFLRTGPLHHRQPPDRVGVTQLSGPLTAVAQPRKLSPRESRGCG